jgi:hypothetical protein
MATILVITIATGFLYFYYYIHIFSCIFSYTSFVSLSCDDHVYSSDTDEVYFCQKVCSMFFDPGLTRDLLRSLIKDLKIFFIMSEHSFLKNKNGKLSIDYKLLIDYALKNNLIQGYDSRFSDREIIDQFKQFLNKLFKGMDFPVSNTRVPDEFIEEL